MLMLANLAPHKGQATALGALKALRDRGIAIDCWFAGEERDAGRSWTRHLEARADELGVAPHVRFLGFRTDGPDLLKAADFFLLPSTHEGLPLSILEAQASGTVVLASPIPGIQEVIEHGVTGFLIDPQDTDGYAARMQQLIEQPESYARTAAAAAARVRENHSWSGYIARAWDLYTELAETP
jgi:glycosyltransferase involved in cell wall biosynthesis